MVSLGDCLIIMKKSLRKVQRKNKGSIVGAYWTGTTSRKSPIGRTSSSSENGQLGRQNQRRRKFGVQVRTDDRVRDYLLGLPEHPGPSAVSSESIGGANTLVKSDPSPCTNVDSSSNFRRGRNERRGRRRSLTYDDISPLNYNRLGLKTAERQTRWKPNEAVSETRKRASNLGNISNESVVQSTSFDISLSDNKLFCVDKNPTDDQEESELDKKYKKDVRNVLQRIDSFSIEPFFSKWKIAGFNNNKVLIRSTATMGDQTETKEVTPEFVHYIKERDAAREEAKKALEELRETQCRLYDAMQEIDRLEKKSKGNKKPPSKKKAITNSTNNGLKIPSAASGSSSGVSSARTSTMNSVRTGTDGVYHPPVEGIEPDVDTCEYYWKVGEMFPTLPMFYVLDAEKKFIKADLDYNGYIDKEELDKVLTDTVGMFTPNQVDSIFKEVDSNNSEMLDFYEVLTVLNKLFSRRRTNLPQTLQQNYSRTCTIQ